MENKTRMSSRFFLLAACFATVLFVSCTQTPDPNLQSFPELKIAIACPCDLKRDSIQESILQEKQISNSVCYSCSDSITSDTYHFNVHARTDKRYSNEQILAEIDSLLYLWPEQHERKKILNNDAMIINHPRARELELFADKFTYYLILEAKDSLDFKFNRYINSIVLK